MSDSDELFLPLTEVVEGLRQQLAQAVLAAHADGVRFQVNGVELEFTVVAKREAGGDGKIKFSVLGVGAELGAAGKMAQERTQKVKLSLTPVLGKAGAEPKKLEISRKPAAKAPAARPAKQAVAVRSAKLR